MTNWPTAPIIWAVMHRNEWRTPRVIWTRTAKGDYSSDIHGVARQRLCEFEDVTEYWETSNQTNKWDTLEHGRFYWTDNHGVVQYDGTAPESLQNIETDIWRCDQADDLAGLTELVFLPRTFWNEINTQTGTYGNLLTEIKRSDDWMRDHGAQLWRVVGQQPEKQAQA